MKLQKVNLPQEVNTYETEDSKTLIVNNANFDNCQRLNRSFTVIVLITAIRKKSKCVCVSVILYAESLSY